MTAANVINTDNLKRVFGLDPPPWWSSLSATWTAITT